MSDVDVTARCLTRLVGMYQILQAAHDGARRLDGWHLDLLPTAATVSGQAQAGAGAVVQRPHRTLGANHLELPIGGRHGPGLHTAGELQLIGRLRVGGHMSADDDAVPRFEFTAHVGDDGVSEEPRHRVDGVDVAM